MDKFSSFSCILIDSVFGGGGEGKGMSIAFQCAK